jgi:hypothetical protein
MPTQNNSTIDQVIEKPHLPMEKSREKARDKEKIQTPEQIVEKNIESEPSVENAQPAEKIGEGGLVGATQAQIQHKKMEEEVESILSKNMEDIYLSLPPDKQLEFKKNGEETVKKITKLLEKAKVRLKNVIELIKKWLLTIPHVNRYFLEQEAKIKADEIIKIKTEEGK